MKRNNSPITQIQTKLSDFSIRLFSFSRLLDEKLEEEEARRGSQKIQEEFVIVPGRLIQLKDPICKNHKIRLSKNGINTRTVYTSDGRSLRSIKLQRYRCKKCGEYRPNYGDFIPHLDNYQEEIKKKARHFYYLGNTPGDIKRIFQINGLSVPSESSIRNWIMEAAEPIEETVMSTTLPVSGYFGFDEIHIRTNRRRAYVFSLVDSWDGFYINAQYSSDRDKGSIVEFLGHSKRRGKTKFKGMTLDGSNNYGAIFKSWRFNYVKVGRCEMHFKGSLNDRIYQLAGLGRKFRRELPEPYASFKKALFAVFDSPTQIGAILQLARAEAKFYGRFSRGLDRIIDHFYKLLPNLLRYYSDKRIRNTNNATERMNKALLKFPSLKHQMRTIGGVNAVVKGLVFLNNFNAFQRYILNKEMKIAKNNKILALFSDDEDLKSETAGLKMHLRWVRRFYGNYKETYNQFFKLKHEVYIVG